MREARAAAALNHPNIRTIHEVGEADGCAYIAMDLIDGESLRSLIDRGGLSRRDVERCGLQLAGGFAHAHERGVVHGDLKPANAIGTRDGHVKLLDFGLARRVAADAATVSQASSWHPESLRERSPTWRPNNCAGILQMRAATSGGWERSGMR